MRVFKKIISIVRSIKVIEERLEKIQRTLGRIEERQLANSPHNKFSDYEYQVSSQWGEDGLIQYLIRNVKVGSPIFIEFGVENYTESNTRFLLTNNNWSGLVIDGSPENIQYIKDDPIYWRHNLKAECAFIDKDNINELFAKNGIAGEIGLLSVDIDGNDYWVWEAIDSVNPAIVITEYNARFGAQQALTVPYDPNFVRSKAHYSMIYYGASLAALCQLGQRKGYAFVGCNTAGNNAFFVRRDLMGAALKELTPEEGFVANKFRESRDANGELTFLTVEQEQALLQTLPLVKVDSNILASGA
ncbi:hypothetical protein [Oxalicibacterium solurbis]|uniref:Uncharacterized protein n=1 Tax=Oxalicibacterium solurbis TaxID=69280 RepID=A0A8J3B3Q4_9BURK|nr:hypothetical protein [Oxalicibacterium solurbis]GGI54435.1 hypothetical protein GCM10011430_16090 [Oxalicibacterium solurbis]